MDEREDMCEEEVASGRDYPQVETSIEEESAISLAGDTSGTLAQDGGDTGVDNGAASATDHLISTGTARTSETNTAHTPTPSTAPDQPAHEHTPSCVTAVCDTDDYQHEHHSGDSTPLPHTSNEPLLAPATAQNEQEEAVGSLSELSVAATKEKEAVGSSPEPSVAAGHDEKPHAQAGGEKLKQEDPSLPMDDRTCRICFCGPEEGRLISPCLCKGSMKYVHLLCLQHWRTASANSKSYFQCDTCHYKYHLRRTFWGSLLTNWLVLQLFTLFALATLIFLSGFVGKFFVWLWFRSAYHPGDEDFVDVDAYGGWLPWVVFDIYAAHWLIGATVVGLLGFVGLLGVGGFHGPVWYGYDARRNGGMVLLIIVIIGLVTAFVGLYRVVRDASKKVLVDLQGQIMEVQHDENAQTYTRSGVGRAEGSAER